MKAHKSKHKEVHAVVPVSIAMPVPVRLKSIKEESNTDCPLDASLENSEKNISKSESDFDVEMEELLGDIERGEDQDVNSDMHQTTELERTKQINFWLLVASHFLLLMDQHLVSLHLTDIGHSFGMTVVEIDTKIGGILHLLLLTAGLPAVILVGLLCKGQNRKTLYICILCSVSIAEISVSWVTEFWQLACLRAISGLHICCWPIIVSLLSDMYESTEFEKKISYIGAAATLGIGFGQVISVLFGDKMRWRVPFLIVGIINLASAMTCQRFITEPVHVFRPSSETGIKFILKRVMNFNNSILFLQSMTQVIPTIMVAVWMNDFIYINMKAPSKLLALIVTASFGFGLLCGELLAPWIFMCFSKLLSCTKNIRMQMLVCICYVAPVLPLVFVVNRSFSIFLCIPLFLSGVCIGVNDILTSVITLEVNERSSKEMVFSIYAFSESLAKGLGAFLISSVVALCGRRQAFSVIPLFWVLSAFLFSSISL